MLTPSGRAWEFLTFFSGMNSSLSSKDGEKKKKKRHLKHMNEFPSQYSLGWAAERLNPSCRPESFQLLLGCFLDPMHLDSSFSRPPVTFLFECLLRLHGLVKWNTFQGRKWASLCPSYFQRHLIFPFSPVIHPWSGQTYSEHQWWTEPSTWLHGTEAVYSWPPKSHPFFTSVLRKLWG